MMFPIVDNLKKNIHFNRQLKWNSSSELQIVIINQQSFQGVNTPGQSFSTLLCKASSVRTIFEPWLFHLPSMWYTFHRYHSELAY